LKQGDLSPMWKRLILVQGHRRSGSTWLAAVLGQAAEAALVPFEPLWLVKHPDQGYTEQLRMMRREAGWWFAVSPENGRDIEHAGLIRRHLESLVQHYFHEPVDTLVIKEPHPNWMPLLRTALQPDYVLFLDRHPLGILNSYEKSGLYEGWETEDEWERFLADMQVYDPVGFPKYASIRHPAMRVACMAFVGRKLCMQAVGDPPHAVVQYEPLCLDPYRHYAALFTTLGWNWDSSARRQVKPLVDPDGENEPGFVAVRKRSWERAYAWRRELAPHTISSTLSFMQEFGWDPQLEDAVLPLTIEERISGSATWLQRRIKWLRRFGLKAVLQSL